MFLLGIFFLSWDLHIAQFPEKKSLLLLCHLPHCLYFELSNELNPKTERNIKDHLVQNLIL